MERKIVFFDIDGTLKPFHKPLPADTREAVAQLMANGHIPVICTGRTWPTMQKVDEVMSLGCPAQICAAGSEVLYHGERIYQRVMEQETLDWSLDLLDRAGCPQVMEGPESLYYQEQWKDAVMPRWGAAIGFTELLHPYVPDGSCRVQKLMAVRSERLSDPAVREQLERRFQVLLYDDGETAELIPKEASKATGIQRLLDHLGMDLRDTYAFGDGPNDLEMLQYVAHGVAMGNAQAEVREAARYVTEDCEAGGIRLALERFGLI